MIMLLAALTEPSTRTPPLFSTNENVPLWPAVEPVPPAAIELRITAGDPEPASWSLLLKKMLPLLPTVDCAYAITVTGLEPEAPLLTTIGLAAEPILPFRVEKMPMPMKTLGLDKAVAPPTA